MFVKENNIETLRETSFPTCLMVPHLFFPTELFQKALLAKAVTVKEPTRSNIFKQ